MTDNKHHWLPEYRCELCTEVFRMQDPAYNDYGAMKFPDVAAPREVPHKCIDGVIGIARLVGLRRFLKATTKETTE